MRRSPSKLAGPALLCILMAAPPAKAQSVGAGFDWLRDNGGDFPGGPGVRVEGTAAAGSFLGFRAAVGRLRGTETQRGTLCTGLIGPGTQCLQEPVETRNRVTAVEAFLLARTPPLAALRLSVGVGVGHYAFDVSAHGETSRREIRPVESRQAHRWVPAYLAELELHPRTWRRLGVTLGARTATVEFRSLVADAWGLYGEPLLTRVSVTANYHLR